MDAIYLIAGLGNPGRQYEKTRHNAGFLVLEHWARKRRASWSLEDRFTARIAKWREGDLTVLFCQPQTFMNASGESVGAVSRYYRVPLQRTMIVVDDADLPLGHIRMRPSGSSGGHHGLESVEAHLGSREYARLRVGIGRVDDRQRDIAGHVLSDFSGAEETLFGQVVHRCCQQLDCWLADGIGKAMSQFNGAIAPNNEKATE
ncbi:MAG: aminoacyl-tRNA hydrolase [Verrucomicrobia bacterium]|nr:aminoacyl-tRNA hydrolase [Verrucomicrobiota bacterium]